MEFEEYIKIANMLKDIQNITNSYPWIFPKKSPFTIYRDRAEKAMCKLKSNLEDMMFIQCSHEICELKEKHPEIATHIFYGENERINLTELKYLKKNIIGLI